MSEERIKHYRDFYLFYLEEHKDPTCRLLHFVGTGLVFSILIVAIASSNYSLLWYAPLAGYGFAWVGHFFFEKNKPATFKYPLWSLLSDFKLFFELLIGRQKFRPTS